MMAHWKVGPAMRNAGEITKRTSGHEAFQFCRPIRPNTVVPLPTQPLVFIVLLMRILRIDRRHDVIQESDWQ